MCAAIFEGFAVVTDLQKMQNGETCTPIMDDYIMGCCDCGLQHRMRFRAIKVAKTLENGEFEYTELDPKKYRVELTAWRASENNNVKEALEMAEAMTQREACDCGCPSGSKAKMLKPALYVAGLLEIKRLLGAV